MGRPKKVVESASEVLEEFDEKQASAIRAAQNKM